MGLKASTNKLSYDCPENFTLKLETIPTSSEMVLTKQGDEGNNSCCIEAPKNEMEVTVREMAPSHYTLEIESFEFLKEILKNSRVERYESPEFEVSGYKWRLILYPEGNRQVNGDDHISLYVEVMDIQKLSPGWEIDALLNFFVYNHKNARYVSFQDGKVKRFSAIKTDWGFSRLIPLKEFENTSNGYLLCDDRHGSSSSCQFGVEVFVLKGESKGESFCTIDDPKNNYFSWKIEKFSKLKAPIDSSEFPVGDYKWKLRLYAPKPKEEKDTKERPKEEEKKKDPKEVPKEEKKEEFVSIFLYLQESNKVLTNGRKMYVEFKLLIRDQYYGDNPNNFEKTGHAWFSSFDNGGWGFRKFIKLRDLERREGLIVNDDMIVEAEISSISITKDLPPKPQEKPRDTDRPAEP